MAQVDSDPRPGGRAPAHRIDQDVVVGEKLRDLGMFALPFVETRKCGVFAWRVRDNDKRHLRSRFLCNGFGTRRCNSARLALGLAKVRRPWRVAEASSLVLRREFEQFFERPWRRVDAFMRIADLEK